MDKERTTKTVIATLKLTFHGSYINVEDIPDYVRTWIDSGFDDRDDLRGWSVSFSEMSVLTGDPNGYDS